MDCSFRLTIPIRSFPVYLFQGLVFGFWLPIAETQAITFADDELAVDGRLWFDLDCTHEKPSADSLFHVAVAAHTVKMDLLLKDVPDDLWPILVGRSQSSPTEVLHQQHVEVERRLHRSAVTYANRLISFCRVYLGQFWLEEHSADPNIADMILGAFSPQISVDGAWHPWYKAGGNNVIDMNTSGGTSAIAEPLWPAVVDYVRRGPRPNLELELLAGADLLAKLGRHRSALVEAAAAFEVALNKFTKAFDQDARVRSQLQGIFPDGGANLASKCKRLGVTHTIRLLLPLLLSPKVAPREQLASVAAAMDERNQIVHDGKRHIKPRDLQRHLTELRALCQTLATLTNDRTNENQADEKD